MPPVSRAARKSVTQADLERLCREHPDLREQLQRYRESREAYDAAFPSEQSADRPAARPRSGYRA